MYTWEAVRESERERERMGKWMMKGGGGGILVRTLVGPRVTYLCAYVCVCVCACVRVYFLDRVREQERSSITCLYNNIFIHVCLHLPCVCTSISSSYVFIFPM